MPHLTHVDTDGKVTMVDVGQKPVTQREATAAGQVRMRPSVTKHVQDQTLPKGNILTTARLAGIMAAKKTSDLIPLCHALQIDSVTVQFQIKENGMVIRATARAEGKTGIEMEALTAVNVAALTIYDMCKALDKNMEVGPVILLRKSGGRTGTYTRQDLPADFLIPLKDLLDQGSTSWL